MKFESTDDLLKAAKSSVSITSYVATQVRAIDFDTDNNSLVLEDKPLNKTARKQILGLLKVPPPFQRRVANHDPNVWKEVHQLLRSFYNTELIARVENKKSGVVRGLFPAGYGYVRDDQFVRTVLSAVDEVEGAQVEYSEFDNDRVTIHISNPEEFNFGLSDDDPDLFKFGQVASNSSVLAARPSVGVSLQRLFCANMMYASQRGQVHSFKVVGTDGASLMGSIKAHVIAGVSNTGPAALYREAVLKMRTQNLSVAELTSYHNSLSAYRDNDGEYLIADIESHLPVGRVMAKYGLTEDDRMDARWRATARTPITAFDAFDFITRVATHNEGINGEDRLSLQILAGRLVFRKWDLLNLAPQVDFSDWD